MRMWPLSFDAVAAAAATRVDVYGHSHGGIVAFGAATLTSQIRRLVLYEGWPVQIRLYTPCLQIPSR
jgi:pimeloyl-ACP methyl ester carboxylesterase